MGGKNTYYETKVYMVAIMIKGKKYEFPCYGMDEIYSVAEPPEKDSYNKMCSKFSVKPSQMKRPVSIDLHEAEFPPSQAYQDDRWCCLVRRSSGESVWWVGPRSGFHSVYDKLPTLCAPNYSHQHSPRNHYESCCQRGILHHPCQDREGIIGVLS